ncbi:hypothetical protein V2J09_020400 [Rumex salicifolius]
MRRALLGRISQCSTKFLSSHPPPTIPHLRPSVRIPLPNPPPAFSLLRSIRLFSTDDTASPPPKSDTELEPESAPESALDKPAEPKDVSAEFEDVSNEELKLRIEKYFNGEEEELSSVLEAILTRKLLKTHDETDDELVEELQYQPLEKVSDEEFESDFEDAHETDEDVANLYNSREIVEKRMKQDPFFNMDDKKWDKVVQQCVQHGMMNDTRECEDILEDMLKWDNLLPDHIKKKVEAKFNELGDMCERQELEPEEAYEHFKEFEDQIVAEYVQKTEAEGPPQFDEEAEKEKKIGSDDPPGEGPILTWQTRVVFAPGGDSWHPKNRKVKLSVNVKELGLSKHQFKRMRDIVGKRYHPGRNELTITSERYDEREENRKDCLRTLLNIIEEAGKANKMVDKARTLYVKERLKANPAFMARLHAKTTKQVACSASS